ncbi:hypothetical protein PFISCL1PPCAC_12487, partial [Pristionchus fissidentatus]
RWALLVLLVMVLSSSGCDIREASLVDFALDTEQPAVICIRVLTSRTGVWQLSNSFPEVWTAQEIRNADLEWDNSIVCLHNRTIPTEYVIACRGTHCALPMRKKDAIDRCTHHIREMMAMVDAFVIAYGIFTFLMFIAGRHYEERPFPKWLTACFAPLVKCLKKCKKEKKEDD